MFREEAEELLQDLTLFYAPVAEVKERRKVAGNPFAWLKTDFANKTHYNFDAPKSLMNELSVNKEQQPKLHAFGELKKAARSEFSATLQEQKFARSLALSRRESVEKQELDFSYFSDENFFSDMASIFDGKNVSGKALKAINERLESLITREEFERREREERLKREREEEEERLRIEREAEAERRRKEREERERRKRERENDVNFTLAGASSKSRNSNSLVPPENAAKSASADSSVPAQTSAAIHYSSTAARVVAIIGFILNNLLMIAMVLVYSPVGLFHKFTSYDFLLYIELMVQFQIKSWRTVFYPIILSVMALIDKFMVGKNLRTKLGYKVFSLIFMAALMALNIWGYIKMGLRHAIGGRNMLTAIVITFAFLFVFLPRCKRMSFIPILSVATLTVFLSYIIVLCVAVPQMVGIDASFRKEIIKELVSLIVTVLPTMLFLILFNAIRKKDSKYTGKAARAVLSVVLCVAHPFVCFML